MTNVIIICFKRLTFFLKNTYCSPLKVIFIRFISLTRQQERGNNTKTCDSNLRYTAKVDGLETEVQRLHGKLVTLCSVEEACHQKDQELQSLRGTLVRTRYESRKTVLTSWCES